MYPRKNCKIYLTVPLLISNLLLKCRILHKIDNFFIHAPGAWIISAITNFFVIVVFRHTTRTRGRDTMYYWDFITTINLINTNNNISWIYFQDLLLIALSSNKIKVMIEAWKMKRLLFFSLQCFLSLIYIAILYSKM